MSVVHEILGYLKAFGRYLLRNGRVWWLLVGVVLGIVSNIVPIVMMILGMNMSGPPKGVEFPVAVRLAAVEEGPLTDAVDVAGTLQAQSGAVLRSEVGGVVKEVPLQEGQRVEAGTVLVHLDDAIPAAQLAQAKAQLRLAQSQLARLKSLREQDAALVAQRDWDTASANVQVAQAAVQGAEAQLGKYNITAPFAGVVGLKRVDVGQYVNPGTELVSLQALDTLKVDFNLPERFALVIQPGMEVGVRVDALGGQPVSASILATDPLVQENSRNVAVRAQLQNPEGTLRPGMFVRVAAVTGVREKALSVPEEAIVPEGDAKFIYKMVEGRAQKVPVQLGLRTLGRVEVTQGLQKGDLVVTEGLLKVHPGSKLVPTNMSVEVASPTVVSGTSK